MNTPRAKRRHEFRPDLSRTMPGGAYSIGLHNKAYAETFAALVSEFEHLELNMAPVMAFLLGATDDGPAGYVLRSLSTTHTRIEVMKALLEKAPVNKTTSEKYDEILAEYDAIRVERNAYVHGLWQTSIKSKRVYWARRAEHHYWFFDLEPMPRAKLIHLLLRLRKLNVRVLTEVRTDLIWRSKPQQPVHLPQPREPTEPRIATRSHHRRSEAKSPPPPPQPSRASPKKKKKD